MSIIHKFLYNRRHRTSGTLSWLRPVCWAFGHDEGTNGRVSWCRRCGLNTWDSRDVTLCRDTTEPRT